MFVLCPGLCVKKRDGLSLFERELLQLNTSIKMKILTVTLFWQFKACVKCKIFFKSLIFSRFLKKESKISIQKDFGHVSITQITESEKKRFIIDSREKLTLDNKSLQIQAKSCDFVLNPYS